MQGLARNDLQRVVAAQAGLKMWGIIRMRLTRTRFLVLIAVAALLVSIPAIVSAQTERPHRFSGNAAIDGRKAPQGTVILAVASGGRVVGTTNVRVISANVNYILDVSRPQSADLELIFRVGGNAGHRNEYLASGGSYISLQLDRFQRGCCHTASSSAARFRWAGDH